MTLYMLLVAVGDLVALIFVLLLAGLWLLQGMQK